MNIWQQCYFNTSKCNVIVCCPYGGFQKLSYIIPCPLIVPAINSEGKEIFLRDIWPTREEIQAVERQFVIPTMFKEVYEKIEVNFWLLVLGVWGCFFWKNRVGVNGPWDRCGKRCWLSALRKLYSMLWRWFGFKTTDSNQTMVLISTKKLAPNLETKAIYFTASNSYRNAHFDSEFSDQLFLIKCIYFHEGMSISVPQSTIECGAFLLMEQFNRN